MSHTDNDKQVAQIKDAINKVVTTGPDFLENKIPPEEMAHTMIQAVKDYAKTARENNMEKPESREAEELLPVLNEIYGCGSGFLADRCDADCVARTIDYLVKEFPAKNK